MATLLEVRQALVARGFIPIPVEGKIPPFKKWQEIQNVSTQMLVAWERNFPRASNTGLLTKFTPVLDVDILDETAAIAIEDLITERFAERGYILPRIGKAPKRAIPFRTLTPFSKITANQIAMDGSTGEKIEFLCDGQQFVAAGIHPDTGKPYAWPLGNPINIARDDLPDINEVEAKTLVDDIVSLLCRDFGYTRPQNRARRGANGVATFAGGPEGWQELYNNILAGTDLHASTRDLAAKLVRGGTDGGVVVNVLRGLMDSSAAPRDERWQDRYDNIPRQVSSIENKIQREREAAEAAAAAAATVASGAAAGTASASAPGASAPGPSPGPSPAATAPGTGTGAPPPPPPQQPPPSVGPSPSAAPGPMPVSLLDDTLDVFEKWLSLSSRTPVYALLGTVAANLLEGDPVWLGIVAPPSSAKTELINSLTGLPFAVSASTLTVASLLSGTPARQQAQGAKGGLLRQVANPGLLCLKDFTSTLTIRPEAKAEVLNALREIYDGYWIRRLGTDGGKVLEWKGKLGLVFACTGVIDTHHSTEDALGNRFLLSRIVAGGEKQFRWALKHSGTGTAIMRRELVASVNALFAAPRPDPQPLAEDEIKRFEKVTELAVRLRGGVERNRHSRELEAIYGAEGPGRIGLALERLLAGLDTLGLGRQTALDVVESVALDSVPPLRRGIYKYLCQPIDPSIPPPPAGPPLPTRSTTDVAKAMRLPSTTVRRGLEDLTSYGLANHLSQGQGVASLWQGIILT
jgi:Bifunctional DNA primase/polymerase, N-terminal